MQYKIPCQHYAEDIPLSQTIPDHHPLTDLQTETLLEAAMTADVVTLESIFSRLAQGIPGMTCPLPLPEDGLAGQKLAWLSGYFYEQHGHWTEPDVRANISALMSE